MRRRLLGLVWLQTFHNARVESLRNDSFSQVYQPYLTLKRSKNNVISVMVVADNKVWTTEERKRRVRAAASPPTGDQLGPA